MNESLDSIKGIRLYQSRTGYRFTIDSILLADYVRKLKPKTIADIGAGNGVIGILLARKYRESKVTLIELQKSLYDLCKRNVALNRLRSRVTPLHADIADVTDLYPPLKNHFDVTVSNPPFRKPKTGKISPHDEKAIARHEIKMDLERLISGADAILKPKGSFYIIFHPERLVELFERMRKAGIEPKRARFIHPDAGSESRMVLVEGIKAARAALKIEKPLIIYNSNGEYTDELRNILDI